jgi:hypothetical protein
MAVPAGTRSIAEDSVKKRYKLVDKSWKIGKYLKYEEHYDRAEDAIVMRQGHPGLKEFIDSNPRVNLCAKQIPDCLALKGMGSGVAMSEPRALFEMEFPMKTVVRRRKVQEDGTITIEKGVFDFIPPDEPEGPWEVYTPEGNMQHMYPNDTEIPKQNQKDKLSIQLRKITGPGRLGPSYISDPFYNMTALAYAQDAGLQKKPEVVFYPADVYHLTEPIRVSHFKEYSGKATSKLKWIDYANVEDKIDFLYRHTHWGFKLDRMTKRPEDKTIGGWAMCLKKRIRYLLLGRHNPRWTKEKASSIYVDAYELRPAKQRCAAFIEMLKTINGDFLGRFHAFPNEVWSWDKYDLYVLDKMSSLIDDLFYDGPMKDAAWDYTTKYSELKRVRKVFKMYAHLGKWEYFSKEGDFNKETPPWLRHKGQLYSKVGEVKDKYLQVQMIGILCQTRGAGKPPYLDILKAERKFLLTVSNPPENIPLEERLVLRAAIDAAVNAMPDVYFTGLQTKARVNVQATACYEKIRREGGTEAAVADLVWDGTMGVHANILDLETGEKIDSFELNKPGTTEGEYIFWRCLEYVVKSDPDELTTSFVTMIKEPGKGRTVTKGSFALKIVLDLVSKICSWPLTKVPSSKSGMGKEAHGWNFFMSLYERHEGTSPFDVHKKTERALTEDLVEQIIEYKDLYVECTDYSEATDNLQHEIAKEIAIPWMRRCGIPTLLRQIVIRATLFPKMIEFTGTNILSSIGEAHPDKPDIRRVRLVRGVLMGDPLTKAILHLINIVARDFGRFCLDKKFWAGILPGSYVGDPRETKTFSKGETKVSPSKPAAGVSMRFPSMSEDARRVAQRKPHYVINRPGFPTQSEIDFLRQAGLDPMTVDFRKPPEMMTKSDFTRRKLDLTKFGGGFVLEPTEKLEVTKDVYHHCITQGAAGKVVDSDGESFSGSH